MQIEGVAYRGRIMVEVEMSLGHFPTVKGEAIQEPDKKMMRVSYLLQCIHIPYNGYFWGGKIFMSSEFLASSWKRFRGRGILNQPLVRVE